MFFSAAFLINAFSCIGSVSYTHLDVYKRQDVTSVPALWRNVSLGRRTAPINSHRWAMYRRTLPVSYTHLDVYKRQGDPLPIYAEKIRQDSTMTAPSRHTPTYPCLLYTSPDSKFPDFGKFSLFSVPKHRYARPVMQSDNGLLPVHPSIGPFPVLPAEAQPA